jgi:predicted metal-dependent peptidase
MGQVELNAAKSEAEGILSATGTREVTYVSVDAAAHSRGRISRASQIDLQGGGGTNMMVGIRAAMENSPRPNIIIVLTDGYSPWDPEPPTRIPIVVCLINGDRSYIPPWAHVVEVNTNE